MLLLNYLGYGNLTDDHVTSSSYAYLYHINNWGLQDGYLHVFSASCAVIRA